MRSYVITQSGEKSQKCNKCDYLVSHSNTLKVHMKITMERKTSNITFFRAGCMKKYTAKRNSFMVKSHKGSQKSYKCSQCEFATSEATNLIAHKES